MLPFIIAGLTIGSVYALAGVGLVLTYKTSKLFNFAHGAIATVSAYLFYTLYVQHGMPWQLAAACCVFVAGPIMGLMFEVLARLVAGAGVTIRVVSTIGVLLTVQAAMLLIYGVALPRQVPQYLPTNPYDLGGTVVTLDRIIVFAVGVLATAFLWLYLRATRTGVAMRAVVNDPGLLDISGTSPTRIRRAAWVIGVVLASASGLLVTPYLALDATALTFLVVAAYGAAALGLFTSLPGTYAGGLAIGVVAALCSKYFTTGVLAMLSTAIPFLALFVVLLISPRRWLAEQPSTIRKATPWALPWQLQAVLGSATLVLLLFVPSFAGIHLTDYSRFLAMTILFLSLGLLVRTSNQVSLAHVTFMAIGAVAYSHLVTDHHWPWGLAILAAGLVAVPIGAILAIPAIRLSGLFLALATFGFGITVQYMFYSSNYMFGVLGDVPMPTPELAAIGLDGSDESYYYLCLALVLTAILLVTVVTRGRLGRLLRALADSPRGLATTGTSVNVTRVLVFCLSAFMAAVAGMLEATAIGSASGTTYLPLQSLVYFAVIVIVGGGAPWYALAAAAGVVLVPSYFTSANTSYWLQLIFGVSAVLFAVTPEHRRATPEQLRAFVDKYFRGRTSRRTSARRATPAEESSAVHVLDTARDVTLRAENITVTFGGLTAVADVSVEVRPGRITGLIGPNGAGKTTLFNACSGLNAPRSGKVTVGGTNLTHRGPAARARHGLGRTYQHMELFDSLTVRENVALGLEGSFASTNALRHLASTRKTRAEVAAVAEQLMDQCGLTELSGRPAGALSTGQRRLVELARCLAGPFDLLLLDEPSSGLDRAETARFGEILKDVVAARGVGIFIVEHDMSLVTEICDYIYVLDFGQQIYEGTPAQVMAAPVVRQAYLGEGGELEQAAGSPSVASEVLS